MLDQFYNYLSDKIIDFFRQNPLSSGAKYNIQFETQEQVIALYEALKNNTLYKEFLYKDSKGEVKYTSYLLDFQGVKLIVSATIGNIKPDFLTRLRNMVGVEEGYEDKGILFIHDTTLDSIMGGTESFSKEGMPFHINAVERDIKSKLVDSDFSTVDKEIINLDLERKKNEIVREGVSIFEYKDLLEIVNGSCIEKSQYKNFGLFPDSKLDGLEGKELTNRLKRNADNFTKVDEIHNYGNPDTQLERYYDEKGVKDLKTTDWKEVDFKDVLKSIDNRKDETPLTYLGSGYEWDKEEGTSKAKARIRNIIIFNPDGLESHEMEFSFDDYLKQGNVKVDFGEAEATASGKKLKIKVKNIEGKSNFYKVIYKNDKGVKFEFKIIMVRCQEKYFDSIKTKFTLFIKKKEQYISINTNGSSVIFNELADESTEYKIEDNYQTINISETEKLTVKISDSFKYENDSDIALFKVKVNEVDIPFGMKGTSEKIGPIDGIRVWSLKRQEKADFKLVGENKLEFKTTEKFTRDEFRKNLELEKKMIELQGMCFVENNKGLNLVDLDIDFEVKASFGRILEYYETSKKLPSLTHLGDNLKVLYENFIKTYVSALNDIKEDDYLSKEQKNLFKIGTIKREVDDNEFILTSLHPLNIAYQLQLNSEVCDEALEDEVIKKFTSTYLLPYFMGEDEKLYVPMEQYHTPEWKYYVDENLPRYKGSRAFVAKLVTEKIEEFVGHFKYMFNMAGSAPIKINLINTGDSKEILQGIFKYYVKQIRDKKISSILPIELCIYSNKNITNAFEEVAFNEDIESLKELYELDLKVDSMSEEDVLNLYRDKVHFYTKKIEDGVEYSHITFLEMSNDIKSITSKMDDIPSGIILDGLISGVPSVFLGETYRTGFGTKYANVNTDLMNIAIRLNALNCALNGEPFKANQCKAISVPNKSRNSLEEVYNASHWVTFIDPKVDLNFFKNDPEAKDLLIIHYSDQYTTAGGYDAITVTRKSIPYQRVIEEFLTKKDVENAEDYSPSIINMFNAINGDWLLRLLSSKSHMPKEKISILSAIKLALAEFKCDTITWIPISLEEVLRVSGGAGLKQSEGFFSAKNLGFDNGATSDDILLVGIEEVNNQVLVHYYPIEVKIGANEPSYIEKGIEQAKKTKKILCETLLPKEDEEITSAQRVYRNFLMQLVVTSAEKLKLYNVCEEFDWNEVIDSDIRRRLLNEDYKIVEEKNSKMGEAGVISFKKGLTNRDKHIEDEVLVIEMSEDDGINYITKSVSEIFELVEGGIEGTVEENYPPIKPDDIGVDDGWIAAEPPGDEYKLTPPEIINPIEPIEPITIPEVKEDRNIEVLFGFNKNTNKEIKWYPNDTDKVFHTNTGIIGTMGTGKTQFTKSLVTQLYRESKYNVDSAPVGILIFDYKGDYNKTKTDFIEATNAQVYELFHLPFNPLSVVRAANSKPMLPLHTANSLKVTLAKAFGLGIKQETLLRDLIMEAYEVRGISKVDASTWDKPAPTLKDVYDIYVNREDLKEDSLYAAFSNLIDFEIFEPDPFETKSLFDLINGVTVIDLSGYDADIQNLVVAITLDLFYAQMQAYGHSKVNGNLRQLNKIVLVDEADNFLSKNFETLKKVLKEGREFGVGTILSTQLLSHFSTGENDYANYILTWIVHNVADLSNKDVKYIFNTNSKQEEEVLFNKIKSLTKHHSLVKMGDSSSPIHMKDKAFWELDK